MLWSKTNDYSHAPTHIKKSYFYSSTIFLLLLKKVIPTKLLFLLKKLNEIKTHCNLFPVAAITKNSMVPIVGPAPHLETTT